MVPRGTQQPVAENMWYFHFHTTIHCQLVSSCQISSLFAGWDTIIRYKDVVSFIYVPVRSSYIPCTHMQINTNPQSQTIISETHAMSSVHWDFDASSRGGLFAATRAIGFGHPSTSFASHSQHLLGYCWEIQHGNWNRKAAVSDRNIITESSKSSNAKIFGVLFLHVVPTFEPQIQPKRKWLWQIQWNCRAPKCTMLPIQ